MVLAVGIFMLLIGNHCCTLGRTPQCAQVYQHCDVAQTSLLLWLAGAANYPPKRVRPTRRPLLPRDALQSNAQFADMHILQRHALVECQTLCLIVP